MNWPILSVLKLSIFLPMSVKSVTVCSLPFLTLTVCFGQLAKRCINCICLFKELAICFTDFLFSVSLISVYI